MFCLTKKQVKHLLPTVAQMIRAQIGQGQPFYTGDQIGQGFEVAQNHGRQNNWSYKKGDILHFNWNNTGDLLAVYRGEYGILSAITRWFPTIWAGSSPTTAEELFDGVQG
jgi:hypothetical protein